MLQGSVSDPVDLGINHMVMLRVAEHLPAAIKPLEDVREDILAQLRQQRASDQARAQSDAMVAALAMMAMMAMAIVAPRATSPVCRVLVRIMNIPPFVPLTDEVSH